MINLSNEFKLFAITVYWLSVASVAKAQIVPDTTLPINSSVTPGCSVCTIEGGTLKGNNLFHSFNLFSVPTGGAALFNNGVDVQNILTRVTGANVSSIDGLIKAQGGANLFIINPNGIIFGANAKLDIGGSFISTTANSVKFADGTEFSAKVADTPLLTISTPIGLNLTNPGTITMHGNGHHLTSTGTFAPIIRQNSTSEFKVKPGQTLALVGGNILLTGGVLVASGGRIELGSVSSGEVKLNWAPNLQLDYTGISSLQDIEIKQRGLADVSGISSGSIQVQGRNINITDGSVLFSQSLGFLPSGSINVNATDSLKLDGSILNGFIRNGIYYQNLGFGQSGDINVTTKRLTLDNGASIINRTFSPVKSGDININATEFIKVSGFLTINPDFNSVITTTTNSTGKAGDINIYTQDLSLFNAGAISSTNFDAGMSGNITVNADVINISDTNPIAVPSSISAPNFGTGKAGNLTLNTRILSIRSGGQVSTSSFNSGDAGNIIINASEYVEVTGRIPIYSSSISSAVDKPPAFLGPLLGLFDTPTATSGDITINTPSLKISDGGGAIVRNQGFGRGGNLEINTDSLLLSDSSSLVADTASGQGGNINLQLRDLQMRRASYITTNAGGSGSGGNININTNTLAAFENSDITANSQDSRGGQVIINAQAIFGTEFRTLQTPLSDITATSALGAEFNGVVDINTIATNPSSGLVELPETIADTKQQISTSCTATNSNKFVIAGSGGLPSTPDDLLVQQATMFEPVDFISSKQNQAPVSNTVNLTPTQQITEAQTLLVDKGEIYLLAQAPTIHHSPALPQPHCS
jgi:filamentous hemagglutinin family protein